MVSLNENLTRCHNTRHSNWFSNWCFLDGTLSQSNGCRADWSQSESELKVSERERTSKNDIDYWNLSQFKIIHGNDENVISYEFVKLILFRVTNLIFRNTFYLISWILKIMKKHETEKLSEEILIKNFHFELYIWEQKRLKLTILCMTYCSEPTDSACCLEWQSAPKSVIAYAF